MDFDTATASCRTQLRLRPTYVCFSALLLVLGLAAAEGPQGFNAGVPGKPIDVSSNPHWQHHLNRDRLYDYYAKQAYYYGGLEADKLPDILPHFPGLDRITSRHFGNQTDQSSRDGRGNATDHGPMLSGTLRIGKHTIVRSVCIRLEQGVNVVYDHHSRQFLAAWRGPFVYRSDVNRGMQNGLYIGATPNVELIKSPAPKGRFLGTYRNGQRVIFSYQNAQGKKTFKSAALKDGKVFGITIPEAEATTPGKAQWPQRLTTAGRLGAHQPYAMDTFTLPYDNPWRSLMFIGGFDFVSESRIAVSTIMGEVWICDVRSEDLSSLSWKRYATGLFEPLGLKVIDGVIHVTCRDQIVALHDHNGDDEADFYRCVFRDFATSPGGHDYVTGLQRDSKGNLYFASHVQGLCRVNADMKSLDVLGTGLRYPNGIGVNTDGSVVLASMQEGNWSPASGICEIKDGNFYGFGGPKTEVTGGYEKAMVYLPRGEDSSSGGQAYIDSDRWGPLKGNWVHLAMSLGEHFLVLREVINGKSQAAAVPLWGAFLSGAHRARMSPFDGQLYVAGTQGYLNYGVKDGSLQRMRYTGGYFHYPSAYETRANGILLSYAQPQPAALGEANLWFAQHWNYKYNMVYGSEEYSPSQPEKKGHDMLHIKSVHLLKGGKQIFVEIPQIRPVDQLHLYHKGSEGRSRTLEFFATIHNLGEAFTDFPGYRAVRKVVKAPPIREAHDPKTMITACIACHHETKRVVGPPMVEIRKLYANNPQGIVDWAMNPQNKTPNTPPMPSFYFAGQKNLMIIAKQILKME
jgi:hypothetical protein